MIKTYTQFDQSDYTAFDDTSTAAINLTEREAAYLLSLTDLLTIREAWDTMTDAEWDTLESELSDLIERIQSV